MKRSLLLLAKILIVILAVLFFRYRWYKLDYYLPKQVTFVAPFRTMAEHNDFMQDKEWPYVMRIDGSHSALFYYGSWHTKDPEDPQIEEIQKLWEEFQPTVAVTENRLGFFVGGINGC